MNKEQIYKEGGPNKTIVHFNACTFMTSSLHKFSAVVQKILFFGAILDKFTLYLVQI